jgi:hypothetical protein
MEYVVVQATGISSLLKPSVITRWRVHEGKKWCSNMLYVTLMNHVIYGRPFQHRQAFP